jgi:L-ribulose-5-phosphate 3-epimerase
MVWFSCLKSRVITVRVSIFSLIFNKRPIGDAIRLTKVIGYDGIELWGKEPHISADSSKGKVKEIRSIADYYGMEIPTIGSYVGGFSTLSDSECKVQLVELEKYLNLMDILKCDIIRVNCGGPNAFLAETYHYERALFWMSKCSDLAKLYNKRIAIEIHNGNLIETIEAADKFLKAVNKENLGVIHDAGNMYITDTDYGSRSVELLGNKIFHVHVKDELRIKEDTLPAAFHDTTKYGDEVFQQKLLGEGAVDHVDLFRGLIKMGYSGFLSCECHAAFPDIDRAVHDLEEIKNQIAKSRL